MIGIVLPVDHVTSAEGHVIPQTITSSYKEKENCDDRDCITGGLCDSTDNVIIRQREREIK